MHHPLLNLAPTFICGNTYRCVWALREYPTTTSEQAILRHLGEKDGVTLRIYTRPPNEEKKIIHNAANKNRMNTANTNDLQQTVTAESNLQMWLPLYQKCIEIENHSFTVQYILNLLQVIT